MRRRKRDDYHPAHAQFTRIDDLKKVHGWEEFTSVPGWDDDFTVNSSGNAVDVGVGVARCASGFAGNERIDCRSFSGIAARSGRNRWHGRRHDIQKPGRMCARRLAFPKSNSNNLGTPLIGFKDPIFRVVSVGQSGNVQRTVQLVFRQTGSTPQLISWKEF